MERLTWNIVDAIKPTIHIPESGNRVMKNTQIYLRWFVIGMGHVLGLMPSVPRARAECSEIEAIGGDFRAVGQDLSRVMQRHPATAESARKLGERVQQLELAGLR